MKDSKKEKSEKVTREFILEKEKMLTEIRRQLEEPLQKAFAPPQQLQAIAKQQIEYIAKLQEETQRAFQPLIKSVEEIQKSYEKLAKSFRQTLQPWIPKKEIMQVIIHEEDVMEKLLLLLDFLENELIKKEEENKELREENKELHEWIRKIREAENECEHLPYIR
jgi:hypothetical protein